MAKRELLSPAHDTASRAIVDVQTATTRVKAIITECISKGVSDKELTKRLNKVIAEECKHINDVGFREQFRKSLVISARKWHYELMQTYRISEENLRRAALKQPLNVELNNLLNKTPYQKQFEFRRLLDDGTNPGIPVIKDYQSSVKLAVKALAAEPPKIVTTKNGGAYIMPARLRAEMAVRYAAAVENLQRLIDSGVSFCWISSHPNCSPRCSPFQGKLYSLFKGKVTIDGKEYGESGTIDGISYKPINEALAGANGDGNGCISGYNCRHRAIEYERGSKPPADYSEAEMKREYAIDKQQRNYENRIRQLKQEEKQLRACGMEKEAAEKRKQWRRLTKDYQIYSIENDRAYYPYRYVIDRTEQEPDEGRVYAQWKKVIGVENMPKTLAEFIEMKYNKNTQETFALLEHYKTSVEKGDIAALSSFENYTNQYNLISKKIVGKIFNDVEIKGISYHFIDRTVGSIYYTYTSNGTAVKHEGVSVENSLEILTNGSPRKIVYDKSGRASQKYILKGIGNVTINPLTGELIQVNRNE